MEQEKRAVLCLLFGSILIWCLLIWKNQPAQSDEVMAKEYAQKTQEKEEPTREDVSQAGIFSSEDQAELVTVAQAAKALALLFAPDGYFENLPKQTNWYDPFWNYLKDCQIQLEDHSFSDPDNIALSGADLYQIIYSCENHYLPKESISILYEFMEEEKLLSETAIHPNDWWNFLDALSNQFGCSYRMKLIDFSLYALCVSPDKTPAIYTDQGVIRCNGLDLEAYVDHRLRGGMIGKELCFFFPLPDEKVIYSNACLTQMDEDNLWFLFEGMTKHYQKKGYFSEVTKEIQIADIIYENGELSLLLKKPLSQSTKVLYQRENGLYLEGQGFYPCADELSLYQKNADGDYKELEICQDLFTGESQFVIEDGCITTIMQSEQRKPENIRVILKNEKTGEIYHDQVKISSETGLILRDGDTGIILQEERTISISAIDFKSPDQVLLVESLSSPESAGNLVGSGTLRVEVLLRSGLSPAYEGRLLIRTDGQGHLVLINEVAFETYLHYVVPSEMPASYGLEAAKVQAVCARTYAAKQMQSNKYPIWGAHLDDSSSFQVYNNSGAREISTRAVSETSGEVLYSPGMQDMIVAYYFSTSCGVTTDARIWIETPENAPYLKERLVEVQKDQTGRLAQTITESHQYVNLQEEDGFQKFIDQPEGDFAEKDCDWFRWSGFISLSEVTQQMNDLLRLRSQANPNLILHMDCQGQFVPGVIDEIGEVYSLEVYKRDAGGIVSELLVRGSKQTILIRKQSNIRSLLGFLKRSYQLQNDRTVVGKSTLPSAFFYLIPYEENGQLAGYEIRGGGYGHGLGLSQNGARAMADQGYSYQEILTFFYDECEVRKMDQIQE